MLIARVKRVLARVCALPFRLSLWILGQHTPNTAEFRCCGTGFEPKKGAHERADNGPEDGGTRGNGSRYWGTYS
jgi:hypothetical protein